MKKKLLLLGSTLIALILEILPYGAVLNFANPEGEPWRKTFSYFDPITFGYANFAPLLVAILTSVLFALTVVSLLTKRQLRIPIAVVSLLAAPLSFAPLLYGVSYFSPVGALISLFLSACACIALINDKKG